jgi:hypothetical protein
MKYKIFITILSGVVLLSALSLHGQILRGSIVVSPYIGAGLPVSDFADNDPDNPGCALSSAGREFSIRRK